MKAKKYTPPFHLICGPVLYRLMHMIDWLPTLYEAAGGDVGVLSAIDGISQWGALVSPPSSRREVFPRDEILYIHQHPLGNSGRTGAIR